MSTPRLAGRNVRSWTDDELRAAIASQHSWRGVARALGLLPASTNNLRRHARRLNLDTSHFSGKRLWSDQKLREAVARSPTWQEVISALGLQDNGVARVRVKGHARRLNLDTSHLDPPAVRPRLGYMEATQPRREMLRLAASAIATAWFTLRGYAAVTAAEGQEYDLVVSLPDGFRRVQVKSTTCRGKTGRWLVGVGRRPYTLDKSATKAPYNPDSVDYFFVVTADGALYLVPSQVFAGRTSISIDSYPEYLVGDASSLLTWQQMPG